MSGHSHWSGIKRKKALIDAKRAQKFTKLGRAITIASREGGENPDFNPNLRLAIEKAKEFNMPKDKILNSIKKGSSNEANDQLEEVIYEALGPGGSMFVIETITDNKNRTVSEIRKLFESCGGKMADGGIGWNFRRKGILKYQLEKGQNEEFIDKAIEFGIEDIIEKDDQISLVCNLDEVSRIKEGLSNYKLIENKIVYLPSLPLEIENVAQTKYEQLFEELENHPDVQEIWDNIKK